MSEDIEKKRLSIHVSLRQHLMWREAATREGFVTLTKYIRHVVTDSTRTGLRVRPGDCRALANTRTHLKIVGRNLNMIAMQLSTLARHPLLATAWQERMNMSADGLIENCEEATANLEAVLKELEQTMKRIG